MTQVALALNEERDDHIQVCHYRYACREKSAIRAVFPDVVTKLSKLLDPAHVTPRVKLCIHTKF